MKCIVTAGPTYEPLDEVRRLTNFSTGKLGSELANYLTSRGHEVDLLLGLSATWGGEQKAKKVHRFTSTEDLSNKLEALASPDVGAVFHTAAVSDFKFGKIWTRDNKGELIEIKSAKISTRDGTMLAELIPTPKVIGHLRRWFPKAHMVGWKYEMEGDQSSVTAKGSTQVEENEIDACVLNGRAWGEGFGYLTSKTIGSGTTFGSKCKVRDADALFVLLEESAKAANLES